MKLGPSWFTIRPHLKQFKGQTSEASETLFITSYLLRHSPDVLVYFSFPISLVALRVPLFIICSDYTCNLYLWHCQGVAHISSCVLYTLWLLCCREHQRLLLTESPGYHRSSGTVMGLKLSDLCLKGRFLTTALAPLPLMFWTSYYVQSVF